MSAKKRTAKKKKDHSIVPVLFTLGVIGWGFFAIDRLTSPLRSPDTIQYSNNLGDPKPKTDSWKKKISKWVENLESQKAPENVKNVSQQSALPVVPDESLGLKLNNVINPDQPDRTPTAEETGPKQGLYQNPVIYYFSSADSGALSLQNITTSGSFSLKDVFTKLIAGPPEQNDDLIDSFPTKPVVHSVRIDGEILTIDLNEKFGMGVSFETLKLQINQLWLTARQFSGVKSLQILINGRRQQTVGSDGFNIPKLINESSWLVSSL